MQGAKRPEEEPANQSWQTIPEMVLSTADRFGDAEASSTVRCATPFATLSIESVVLQAHSLI